MPEPQVVALHGEFYAFVEGRLHGPWSMFQYAQAGLATEIRRMNKRSSKVSEEQR